MRDADRNSLNTGVGASSQSEKGWYFTSDDGLACGRMVFWPISSLPMHTTLPHQHGLSPPMTASPTRNCVDRRQYFRCAATLRQQPWSRCPDEED
ncbi:hypothetical protein HN51_010901 [Arachis hypogaea]